MNQYALATAGGPSAPGFLDEVLEGLAQPQKTLPAKYFYDSHGAGLFEQITTTPEYYLTRVETVLLEQSSRQIAQSAGPRAALVELGSGAGIKIRLLLDALDQPSIYVPIDISTEQLLAVAGQIAADYPALTVVPVAADFFRGFALPRVVTAGRAMVFYPGSTIGNLRPAEAVGFLRRIGLRIGAGCRMLIGVDRRKDIATLEAAYNDSAGITAAFNRNILTRINRELQADFEPERFRHRAFYNVGRHRIEMHLQSIGPQAVVVAGHLIRFTDGETIHTENSYKYSPPLFRRMASRAGWQAVQHWTDEREMCSLHWLVFTG